MAASSSRSPRRSAWPAAPTRCSALPKPLTAKTWEGLGFCGTAGAGNPRGGRARGRHLLPARQGALPGLRLRPGAAPCPKPSHTAGLKQVSGFCGAAGADHPVSGGIFFPLAKALCLACGSDPVRRPALNPHCKDIGRVGILRHCWRRPPRRWPRARAALSSCSPRRSAWPAPPTRCGALP